MKTFRAPSLPLVLALAMFVWLCGGPLQAQEGAAGKLWSGVLVPKGSGDPLDTPAEAGADGLARHMAEIQVAWQTERNLVQCDQQWQYLWLVVNDARYTGERAPLYVDYALGRARFLESTGRLAEARATLDSFLLPAQGPEMLMWQAELVGATPAAAAAAAAAANDPAILEQRQGLDLRLGGAAADSPPAAEGAGGDPGRPLADDLRRILPEDRFAFLESAFGLPSRSLDREVQRMFDDQNDKGLANLGLRAAPSLAYRVLAALEDPVVDSLFDPLEVLLRIDPEGAVALMDSFLEQAPESWRFHVLELLEERMPHNLIGGLWTSGESWPRPPSRLASLTGRLLLTERLRTRVWPLLLNQANAGAFGPELTWLVGDLIRKDGQDGALWIMQLLAPDGYPKPRTEALWRRLLDEDDRPAVRELAARCLSRCRDASGLAGLVDDPDPRIRGVALELLRERKYYAWSWTVYDQQLTNRSILPEKDERYYELLGRFLDDEDDGLRASAQEILLSTEPDRWRPEWLDALLRRAGSDPEFADELGVKDLAPEQRRAVDQVLADSRDLGILAKLDQRLQSWDWLHDAETGLPLLQRRWEDPEHPFLWKGDRNRMLGFWTDQVAKSPQAVAFVVRVAVETRDSRLLTTTIRRTWSEEAGDSLGHQAVRLLSPQDLFAVLDLWNSTFEDPWKLFLQPLLERADAPEWIPEIARPSAERSLLQRTIACNLAARLGHPDAEALILALLREPAWLAQSQDVRRAASYSVFTFEDPARQLAFLESLLADAGIPNPVKLWPLAHFGDLDQRDAVALAEKVLAWSSVDDVLAPAIRHAVEILGAAPRTPARIELLARAAVAGSLTATQALAADRDPAQVGTMVAVLQSRALEGRERARLQAAAVEGLTGIGDAAAAIALAEGLLWAENPDVRADIAQSLAALRQYQEEIRYWRGDPEDVAPTRESALQELLGMLRDGDPAVRAEAARSLAAFETLECLPALIRLLKDGHEEVRAAAREALDRLQAPRSKGPPILF
ncbi:MAG: HEAT repeat domain-containing protein [Planctomycetes bacterium]|nr:HEAT repeat domain-containing protein [Planctomycetota bacterium]MBL7008157.1 HEAT repeat domain-containing protein [Planctomycetota bacterium]